MKNASLYLLLHFSCTSVYKGVFFVCVLLFCELSLASGPVVINEIYYHPGPVSDRTYEFVELKNREDSEVDLSFWHFSSGIDFRFPEGTTVEGGGFLVVCRNRARFAKRFGIPERLLCGDFLGTLADNGERIVLRDRENRVVCSLFYHNQKPWSEEAAGEGSSLQRISPKAAPYLGASWLGEPPTPLGPAEGAKASFPGYVPPPVVITELYYHPLRERDSELEFVEIYNRGTEAQDLSGWSTTGGRFRFPTGTVLRPGSYIVVCRNKEAFEEVFGGVRAFGDFDGKLSNRGERVALLNARGQVVDAVFYGSSGQWPSAPDGSGFSLERIYTGAPGEDPANWGACTGEGLNTFQTVSGTAGGILPGNRYLSLYLTGSGECLIDDVVLEDVSNPGENLVSNGDFEQNLDAWSIRERGVHSSSSWAPEAGVSGSGALRLTAFRSCGRDCLWTDSVYTRTNSLSRNATYRLKMKFKPLRGTVRVTCDLEGRLTVTGGPPAVHTAGRRNSIAAAGPRPLLVGRGRFPLEPRPSDSTLITATVRSQEPLDSVVLRAVTEVRGDREEYPLYDDGKHEDRLAGDGIWGTRLPEYKHNTTVLYTLELCRPNGVKTTYPPPYEMSHYFGYYVNGNQADSSLPVYHILVPELEGSEPGEVNGYLSCFCYKPGHFAFKGEVFPEVAVRFRGYTGCVIEKRHFKVKFNQGRYFQDVRKINLNSLWTDKALIREHLAWEFLRSVGSPYCETEFVRLHVNGEYYGLYLYLEHPDNRFLERNRWNKDGDLYKAEMGPRRGGECEFTPGFSKYSTLGQYSNYWEQETNEDGDFRPLRDFIDTLHASRGSLDFFREHVDPDSVIAFQTGQVALRNVDSAVKNHFLFFDPEEELWSVLPWDLDLSFGKYFTMNAVGPGRPVGTLNDRMSCPGYYFSVWTGAGLTECVFPANWLLHYFFEAGDRYYRRAYLIRLWDVLQEKYTRERFDPYIDRLCDYLRAEESEDLEKWGRYPSNIEPDERPPPPPPDMVSNVEILKEQISCHRNQLISRFPEDIRSHSRLRVTEILAGPEGSGEELEFVELYNPGERTVSLSGWSLSGVDYTFPEGVSVDGRDVIVVARSPAAFEEEYGFHPLGPYLGELDNYGEEIRVYEREMPGSHPAVIDRLRYKSGGSWPEFWRGYSLELTEWEGNVDNDRGELWRRSSAVGGTPGRLPGFRVAFIRGDPDQDGDICFEDVIHILEYLFAGSKAPACLDSADANDDGVLDAADAVYLCHFLFNGIPSLPEPFDKCGFDTENPLGCERFAPCAGGGDSSPQSTGSQTPQEAGRI